MWKIQQFLCPLGPVNWQAQCSNLKRQRRNCSSESMLHTDSFRLFTWWSSAGELVVCMETFAYYCMILLHAIKPVKIIIQACYFSGFYRNSGFLIFLPKNPFLRFTYKQGENWGDLLFTFALLSRGVLDVETIYFVSL